ncbi:Alpha/beta knot methyltransferase [Scheffersomyces coipomensis]|uniref:Alpha/beta knot methyltransferase n=1 Tax=Scheffersomyces coipomensis TaxID=1788519 RepID=UPI00315D29AE
MIPRRFFSLSITRLAKPNGASSRPTKNTNPFFDGSLDSPQKIWDKKGLSKDEFFKKKYGHVTPEQREKLNQKVDRQKRYRQMKSDHLKQQNMDRFGDDYRSRGPSVVTRDRQDFIYNNGGSSRNRSLGEYIFGTHAVKSVLTANKRESYTKLYVHNCKDPAIIKLAESLGIKIEKVSSKSELNQLTSNGVHNGVVLWTKSLQIPEIYSLGEVTEENGEYSIVTHPEEEGADKITTVKTSNSASREKRPLGIYLDAITDPQNMGNILRTAYYFGVDFIVTSSQISARLGAVTNKASAGALDFSDIYKVQDSITFIDRIKKNGWAVISTSSKPTPSELETMSAKEVKVHDHLSTKFVDMNDLGGICSKVPVLLVLGSEGEGIRTNVKVRSDFLVSIDKGRTDEQNIVDSLNVAVASGILIGKCLE